MHFLGDPDLETFFMEHNCDECSSSGNCLFEDQIRRAKKEDGLTGLDTETKLFMAESDASAQALKLDLMTKEVVRLRKALQKEVATHQGDNSRLNNKHVELLENYRQAKRNNSNLVDELSSAKKELADIQERDQRNGKLLQAIRSIIFHNGRNPGRCTKLLREKLGVNLPPKTKKSESVAAAGTDDSGSATE